MPKNFATMEIENGGQQQKGKVELIVISKIDFANGIQKAQ